MHLVWLCLCLFSRRGPTGPRFGPQNDKMKQWVQTHSLWHLKARGQSSIASSLEFWCWCYATMARHVYQKLQVVSGLCKRGRLVQVIVQPSQEVPVPSAACFHINPQPEPGREQRRALFRLSGTQGCFSPLCSFLTVCHCEHMKPDATITEFRNVVCTLPGLFTSVCVWSWTPSVRSSQCVYVCLWQPMHLPDGLFCSGYGFACLIKIKCNQAQVHDW